MPGRHRASPPLARQDGLPIFSLKIPRVRAAFFAGGARLAPMYLPLTPRPLRKKGENEIELENPGSDGRQQLVIRTRKMGCRKARAGRQSGHQVINAGDGRHQHPRRSCWIC